MDFLRAILNDFLNGFSADDIPVFLGRLFLSGILAFIIKLIFSKKYKGETKSVINHSVFLSIIVVICIPVAQFSISLGLIMSALIVAFVMSIKASSNKELVYTLATLLLAASIGAGYVVYSLIGAIIAVIYILISKD